jgi:methionyl-tRNA formyltransferase
MRVLFFGTSDFAVPSLDALVACPEVEVVAVVTQPDRPQGRGRQLATSPVKRAAVAHDLPVIQPPRVRARSFREQVAALRPDALALAAFGQLIPPALLDLPPLGPINVHGSLLPAYRGAAPIQQAILNGEERTGVTTMWMDATLDTGDVLLARAVAISPDDTTGTLTERLANAGANLLIETLRLLRDGRCPRAAQNHILATYAPAIEPADAVVHWNEPATRVRDRIRAMAPRPGAVTSIRGRRLKLWLAEARPGVGNTPGCVLAVARDGVEVAAGEGILLLREVQAENSRRMPASDWARGARIAAGDAFEACAEDPPAH